VASFASLALTVIDEEQRFGVEQRSLVSELTNTLYTTATPIPRSLFLVDFQDNFLVSSLVDKLPIKRPVQTLLRDFTELKNIISFIGRHIQDGTKVFWVTPALNRSPRFKGSSAV
jgi:ATP-dependent DNA helicase RecG